MLFARKILLAAMLAGAMPLHATVIPPFISEFHYDNAGADVNEFVAVSGRAGFDLSGWKIALYNGANGKPYRTLRLNNTLGGLPGELVETFWPLVGIQNGPDGIALISASDRVVDFVAYEGALSALEGPAAGASAAHELPVRESAATPVGYSLQRVGAIADQAWLAEAATPGQVNPGLRDTRLGVVGTPGAAALLVTGLFGWLGSKARCVGHHKRRRAPATTTAKRQKILSCLSICSGWPRSRTCREGSA